MYSKRPFTNPQHPSPYQSIYYSTRTQAYLPVAQNRLLQYRLLSALVKHAYARCLYSSPCSLVCRHSSSGKEDHPSLSSLSVDYPRAAKTSTLGYAAGNLGVFHLSNGSQNDKNYKAQLPKGGVERLVIFWTHLSNGYIVMKCLQQVVSSPIQWVLSQSDCSVQGKVYGGMIASLTLKGQCPQAHYRLTIQQHFYQHHISVSHHLYLHLS